MNQIMFINDHLYFWINNLAENIDHNKNQDHVWYLCMSNHFDLKNQCIWYRVEWPAKKYISS